MDKQEIVAELRKDGHEKEAKYIEDIDDGLIATVNTIVWKTAPSVPREQRFLCVMDICLHLEAAVKHRKDPRRGK